MGCTQSYGSSLLVKGPGRIERVLVWAWTGTPADSIGDPVDGETLYAICVYDSGGPFGMGPRLVTTAVLPPGRGWQQSTDRLLAYVDRAGLNGGVNVLAITADPIRTRTILLEASDDRLMLPQPAGGRLIQEDPELRIQLVNSVGTCWEATYDRPAIISTSRLFWDVE